MFTSYLSVVWEVNGLCFGSVTFEADFDVLVFSVHIIKHNSRGDVQYLQ